MRRRLLLFSLILSVSVLSCFAAGNNYWLSFNGVFSGVIPGEVNGGISLTSITFFGAAEEESSEAEVTVIERQRSIGKPLTTVGIPVPDRIEPKWETSKLKTPGYNFKWDNIGLFADLSVYMGKHATEGFQTAIAINAGAAFRQELMDNLTLYEAGAISFMPKFTSTKWGSYFFGLVGQVGVKYDIAKGVFANGGLRLSAYPPAFGKYALPDDQIFKLYITAFLGAGFEF